MIEGFVSKWLPVDEACATKIAQKLACLEEPENPEESLHERMLEIREDIMQRGLLGLPPIEGEEFKLTWLPPAPEKEGVTVSLDPTSVRCPYDAIDVHSMDDGRFISSIKLNG